MATWGLSSQIDVQVHIYCVHYFDLPPSLGMIPQTQLMKLNRGVYINKAHDNLSGLQNTLKTIYSVTYY